MEEELTALLNDIVVHIELSMSEGLWVATRLDNLPYVITKASVKGVVEEALTDKGYIILERKKI